MIQVLALVEGDTEEQFVSKVLGGALNSDCFHIRPINWHGITRYAAARRELVQFVKTGPHTITTMFDYYGLPMDWPGRREAQGMAHGKNVRHVEREILADIAGDDLALRQKFIPYIQYHEFETLLFCDPAVVAGLMGSQRKAYELQAVVDQFGGDVERIDDDHNTCPSRRLQGFFPEYQKPLHGRMAIERLGLSAVRGRCSHFDEWFGKLLDLARMLP
jgi:hypothetical protein